jgi:hypothetical protein
MVCEKCMDRVHQFKGVVFAVVLVINLLSSMMFCIDEYLRVPTFHVHLGMMEVVQHLGDAVSAEMFQMVRVSAVR